MSYSESTQPKSPESLADKAAIVRDGFVDFSKLPGRDKRKIQKYMAQQRSKHMGKGEAYIQQKAIKKFNISFKNSDQ